MLSLDAQIEQTAARLESCRTEILAYVRAEKGQCLSCQDRVTDHERMSRSLASLVELRQAQGPVKLALPAKAPAESCWPFCTDAELPPPPKELHIVIEPLTYPKNPDARHMTAAQHEFAASDPTYPARLSRWQKFDAARGK